MSTYMKLFCPICTLELKNSEHIYSTRCGHVFHWTCLSEWLQRSKTCPQCRETTDTQYLIRLYLNSKSYLDPTKLNKGLEKDLQSLKNRYMILKSDFEYTKNLEEKYKKKYECRQKRIDSLVKMNTRLREEKDDLKIAMIDLDDEVKQLKKQKKK